MARRDLPPLRALMAFEAAARLGSFRFAADELGITRSAVSHQIKALEDALSVVLFQRDARRAELSHAGHIYYPAVRDAFDQIETHTQMIAPRADEGELTVQVYATVALKWLIPRLHAFEREYPDMRIRLSTSYVNWDFDSANADVALVLARTRSPEHYHRPLFGSMLTPVCAPRLLAGPNALREPGDLVHHRLLYVYTAEEDWHLWLQAAGVEQFALSEHVAFDSYVLAQEAALEGEGVAMTIGPFAGEDIKAGRLVQPFELMVPHRYSWDFVCAKTDRLRPKIRQFESWLAGQVATAPEMRLYRNDEAHQQRGTG